jgi:membrane-associated phospholipid phosphatase
MFYLPFVIILITYICINNTDFMKYRIIILAIFMAPVFILAQDSIYVRQTIPEKLLQDAGYFGRDALGFFTAPARFSGTDWLYTAGAVGGTYLLMQTDEEFKERFSRSSSSTLNKDFWDVPTYYGYIAPANVITLSVYAAGLFSGDDNIRTTGRLAFEAISISGISVMAVRYIFGRSRPFFNDPHKFNWFESRNEIQSFPSGHTVVAFAMSTVFAERIDNIWARIGFYGMATLTGCARIRNNQHWFSDVVTGAALGIGAGLYVLKMEKERGNPEAEQTGGVVIYPGYNKMYISFRF